MSSLLNQKAVKDLIKSEDRRCGRDFMVALESFIDWKVRRACAVHNGGKKTLDRVVAEHVGIKPKGE